MALAPNTGYRMLNPTRPRANPRPYATVPNTTASPPKGVAASPDDVLYGPPGNSQQYYDAMRGKTSGGGDSGPQAPSYSNTIPNAGSYLEQERRALQAWQNAQASVRSNQSSLLHKYGLTGNFDDKGNVSGVQIDPSSQYGLTQQMLHNQADNMDSIREDAAGRGFHGAGLGNQALNDYRWNMGRDSYNLGNQFTGEASQLAQTLQGAGADYQNALWTTEQGAANDAISGGNFNPADIGTIKEYLKKLFGSSYQGVLG